jgi:large subunit ribosomal protein L23
MAMFSKKTKDDAATSPAKKEVKAKAPVAKKVEAPAMKDLYASDNKTGKTASKKTGVSLAYRILTKPLVTEKATTLGGQNKYVFVVDINANKIEVAKAIFEVYGVKPSQVNIIKMKGKQVARGRVAGRRKNFKKAIVTLKKGETIKVYEGV